MCRWSLMDEIGASNLFSVGALHTVGTTDTLELTGSWGSFGLVAPTGTFTRQRGDGADPARLMVVSEERYGLEVEFNTKPSVCAYLESWYVNDAESAVGQQLLNRPREIETETLELVLARVLPTYNVAYRQGIDTFRVDNRGFVVRRAGDHAVVVDTLMDTPIFIGVVTGDTSDIVTAFEGAIDGRCRGLAS